MLKISYYFLVFYAILATIISPSSVANIIDDANEGGSGEDWAPQPQPLPLVKREERRCLVSTEYGEISAARINFHSSSYLLHFFTLDPNSLLLPLILHSDMVFYVHTVFNTCQEQEEEEARWKEEEKQEEQQGGRTEEEHAAEEERRREEEAETEEAARRHEGERERHKKKKAKERKKSNEAVIIREKGVKTKAKVMKNGEQF